MTSKEFVKNYWRYYLMLENRVIETFRYVELSKDNFSTYSNEYASLLITIGSELDSFFKIFCNITNNKKANITSYRKIVMESVEDIIAVNISIDQCDMLIAPFENWEKGNAGDLKAWKAFTNIKHNRSKKYEFASLGNVICCLACLFYLEMYYYKSIVDEDLEPNIPTIPSRLFKILGWTDRYTIINSNVVIDNEG